MKMNTIHSLVFIAAFAACFIALAVLLCAFTAEVKKNDPLLYVGVLYVGKNDKPVDCYRHLETNAVYYKLGQQYRNANTGRIVSTVAALDGAY